MSSVQKQLAHTVQLTGRDPTLHLHVMYTHRSQRLSTAAVTYDSRRFRFPPARIRNISASKARHLAD
jgi:hypothetical protein